MLYKTYDSTQMCHICPRTPGKTKKQTKTSYITEQTESRPN